MRTPSKVKPLNLPKGQTQTQLDTAGCLRRARNQNQRFKDEFRKDFGRDWRETRRLAAHETRSSCALAALMQEIEEAE